MKAPWAHVAWMLAACLPLVAVAALNGFPLVYFDTGTYLQSAVAGVVPDDRPVMYGLFLRACLALAGSLWAPVLVQAAIVVACLRAAVPGMAAARFCATVAVLSLGSGLPWLTGQLMPDVFTATLILSFAILAEGHVTGARRALLCAVLVLSMLVHHSHVLIVAIGVTGLTVYAQRWARTSLRACALLGALLVSGVVLTPLTHRVLTGEFFYSRGGHHFLMARMLQWGVMQRYLDDRCPRIASPFCTYRALLSTPVGDDYLWDARSPLTTLGGWRAQQRETRDVIVGAVAAYPGTTVARAAADALRQLARTRTGEGTYPYASSMTVVRQIGLRPPAERSAFAASAQQRGLLFPITRALSWVHLGALVLALATLLRSGARRTLRVAVVIGLMVVNAMVCGVLSKPDDRYGARVAWLPVFLALVARTESRRWGAEIAPADPA